MYSTWEGWDVLRTTTLSQKVGNRFPVMRRQNAEEWKPQTLLLIKSGVEGRSGGLNCVFYPITECATENNSPLIAHTTGEMGG
jgi:hypothetical protein